MPLRDHFRPPVSDRSGWEELHGGWPMVIVQQLGRTLPEQYVAAPRVHLGAEMEVDIGTLERLDSEARGDTDQGTSTRWAPTAPTLKIETELADADAYEVRVYDAKHGRRLVAAVEIVSPRNKDRPKARAQFVAKCAALLRQQVSIVIVDLVTERSANLYAELLKWIDERDPSLGDTPQMIYSVACRWHWRETGLHPWLETWNRPLVVGEVMPTLPLWLSNDLAIPLDLEASYEQTCRDLRIV